MNIKDDMNSFRVKAGWSLTDVAAELTKRQGKNVTIQNLSNKMTSGTIKHIEVLEFADIIGYELKWVKKGTED